MFYQSISQSKQRVIGSYLDNIVNVEDVQKTDAKHFCFHPFESEDQLLFSLFMHFKFSIVLGFLLLL